MPYINYAKNDETGRHYGWDGRQWVTITDLNELPPDLHPRNDPNSVAGRALARQPQMIADRNKAQKDANPNALGQVGKFIGGAWESTVGGLPQMGAEMQSFAERHPVASAAFPFLPAATTLGKGVKEGVERRAGSMGTAIDEGNYLRAGGDALSILTAPVGGTAVADASDVVADEPARGLGQLAGMGGMAAAGYAAPKVLPKIPGSIGRAAQRAGAERAVLASGVKDYPSVLHEMGIDETGRPTGPITKVLDSPEGLPVARSKRRLYDEVLKRQEAAGAEVGRVKRGVEPGQYVLPPEQIQAKIIDPLNNAQRGYANTIGGEPVVGADGGLTGATVDGTAAIGAFDQIKADIQSSINPTTGALDLVDLFRKLDQYDEVYKQAKVAAGGKLAKTSSAYVQKTAADNLRGVLAENIPGLRDVNAEFHGFSNMEENLARSLPADKEFFGPRAKRFLAYVLPSSVGAGAVIGPGAGMAVAGGAAAIESLRAILTSTPMRTWSANKLWQFGRMLEHGDIAGAHQIAQAAAAEVAANSDNPAVLPNPAAGGGAVQSTALPARTTPPTSPSTPAENWAAVEDFDFELPKAPSAQSAGIPRPDPELIAPTPPSAKLPISKPTPEQLASQAGEAQAAAAAARTARGVTVSPQTQTPAEIATNPFRQKAATDFIDSMRTKLLNGGEKIPFTDEMKVVAKRLRFHLRADDWLGFESPKDAVQAILDYPDFAKRWNVSAPVAAEGKRIHDLFAAEKARIKGGTGEVRKFTGPKPTKPKPTKISDLTSTSIEPKRIIASRRGQRIEGVVAREFQTAKGRAMVLRADDGTERLVFDREVTA